MAFRKATDDEIYRVLAITESKLSVSKVSQFLLIGYQEVFDWHTLKASLERMVAEGRLERKAVRGTIRYAAVKKEERKR